MQIILLAARYKNIRRDNKRKPVISDINNFGKIVGFTGKNIRHANVNAVMDGDIDLFINGYLKWINTGKRD